MANLEGASQNKGYLMSEHEHSTRGTPPSGSFWRSRAGIVLIAFLAVSGLLLTYEHRAHVFTGNGILIVLLLVCVGMHLFMHGGHGGGGRDSNGGGRP
jgi:hypothetical protein